MLGSNSPGTGSTSELKYSEILKLHKESGSNLNSGPYRVSVLSNITVHQIKEILELPLRLEHINADVSIGDYDNIVQDSLNCEGSNAVIIFWELCNIVDGLQHRIELFDDEQLDAILEKAKSEIDLVFKNLQQTSLVLINKFTALQFSRSNIRCNRLEELANQLNRYLTQQMPANTRLVGIEKVLSDVGVANALDMRYYYSSKALYTIEFFKAYSRYISPFFMSANGKAKKALILDCDNTLWHGVLGEDGFDNIDMSPNSKIGAIFSEIQAMALTLNKQGVLLCLCSKNNPADVAAVVSSHPDFQLRKEYITINKSNWQDKVSNIRDISETLNIGMDSFVFVDDSPFEANMIREHLPEVTVLQVPERLHEYPQMFRDNLSLFYNLSFTAEDKNKVEMYKQQAKRDSAKKGYTDIEDYLASLGLKLTVSVDDMSIVPRMSQLSQKTNQFNLTTKRYTEGEITSFIENEDSKVFSFSVADRFGDSGVTGLCIVKLCDDSRMADVDTFLMSCRVLGRNIEYAFVDYLLGTLKQSEVKTVAAQYSSTNKNEQVEDFYDKCCFVAKSDSNSTKKYSLDLVKYEPKRLTYIQVINGRSD